MPRNGSGTYTPPVNSWNPAVTGQPISSTDWQATLADLADALTNSVDPDGQTPLTGDLNVNGHTLLAVEQILAESPSTSTTVPYSFAGDPNTGMGQTSGNNITWYVNGAVGARMGTNAIFFDLQARAAFGSVASPAYSFDGANSTGFFYSSGNAEVRVSIAGTSIMSWGADRPYINTITSDLSATPLGRLTGGIYQITSSGRIKANIRDHVPNDAKFLSYRIRNYERKTPDGYEPGRTYCGVVVEELWDTHPDRVNLDEEGLPISPDSGAMIGECIAMIQKLMARVEALENAA